MKKSLRLLSLLLATLTVCGCGGGGSDDSANTDAGTVPEGTAATEVEPLSVSLTSASLEDDKFTLGFKPSRKFDGEAKLEVLYGDKTESTSLKQSFEGSVEYPVTLQKGKTELGGDLSVMLTVYDGNGNEAQKSAYQYKNGIPQLSEDNIDIIIDELTVEEKAALCINRDVQKYSSATYKIERCSIPSVIMSDGVYGVRIDGVKAFAYPSPSSLSQTWDTEMISDIAEYMAQDFEDYGIDVMLAPGLNLYKNVLNGRNFEYFSEDPYLTGKAGEAYVNGAQSQGIGVSIKHFAANNQETSRTVTDSVLTERALREIYTKAFAYAVKAQPWTLMTSYNKLNGKYAATRADLINTLLRGEMGFDGCITSDWGAGGTRDGMINAGNDLFSGGPTQDKNAKTIVELVEKGKIEEAQLDFCVKNILSLVVKTKTFKNGENNRVVMKIKNREAKEEISRKAASEGMTLLKNNGALPVTDGEIALFGNASVHTVYGGHGASNVGVTDFVSVKEGLQAAGGVTLNETVNKLYQGCKGHNWYITGSNPEDDTLEVIIDEQQAKQAAAEASVAIMTISRISTEGADHEDRDGDYRLNAAERKTLKNVSDAFHAAGKKVIVLINSAIPLQVSEWEADVDAILNIGIAGEQIGNAAADVITGKVNPSGKLTVSWPLCIADTPASDYFPGNANTTLYYEDIYVGYRYYTTFDVAVSYPFGHGLSYTTFEYSDYKLSSDTYSGSVEASVKITNKGSMAGREAVQFYISKPDGVNEQAKYELCGFGKTKELKPGESEIVTVKITQDEFKTYITSDSAWVIEQGDYKISVGASVADIKFTETVKVAEKTVVADVENVCVPEKTFDVITKKTGKGGIAEVDGTNVALGKSATATKTENDQYIADYAFDGDATTRWSGPGGGEITVDLGAEYELKLMRIVWEANSSSRYTVSLSSDGKAWDKLGRYDVLGAKFDTVQLDGKKARYVKISVPSSQWLSIYECEIYSEKA